MLTLATQVPKLQQTTARSRPKQTFFQKPPSPKHHRTYKTKNRRLPTAKSNLDTKIGSIPTNRSTLRTTTSIRRPWNENKSMAVARKPPAHESRTGWAAGPYPGVTSPSSRCSRCVTSHIRPAPSWPRAPLRPWRPPRPRPTSEHPWEINNSPCYRARRFATRPSRSTPRYAPVLFHINIYRECVKL